MKVHIHESVKESESASVVIGLGLLDSWCYVDLKDSTV